MKTGKKVKFNNEGFSLLELIVVISIMVILAGVSTYGINLAYSQDANRCATTLDEALTESRMITMSKQGEFSLEISKDASNKYFARLIKTSPDDGSVTEEKHYDLEGDGKKIDTITVKGSGVTETVISGSDKVVIVFDRTKGNVLSATIGGNSISGDTILVFNIASLRGKTANVSIVTGTGKHDVGTYE